MAAPNGLPRAPMSSKNSPQARGRPKKVLPEASPKNAETLLVDLATGGDDRAFYELGIEQMVAQMNAAVQITLDYPKEYCGPAGGGVAGRRCRRRGHGDFAIAGRREDAQGGAFGRLSRGASAYRSSRPRNLDAVQIALGSRWQFWMQTTAIVLSVLLLELGVVLVRRRGPGRDVARNTGRDPGRLSGAGRPRFGFRASNAAQISN